MMDNKERVEIEEEKLEEESNAETTGSVQATEQTVPHDDDVAESETTTDIEEVDAESVTLESPGEIIARLEAEVVEAKVKADQYLDQMQRTAAEFQNVRRRQERQLQESLDRATEGLIRRLMPVLDDFELAFKRVPESLQAEEAAWVEGFQHIQQKLSALLAEEGITPIDPEGPFDPSRHEAVTNEPSDTVESGHIIETLRTGYEYKDRVLRPALVRVAQ